MNPMRWRVLVLALLVAALVTGCEPLWGLLYGAKRLLGCGAGYGPSTQVIVVGEGDDYTWLLLVVLIFPLLVMIKGRFRR